MVAACRRRLLLANAFATSAVTYGLTVHPQVHRELRRWRALAERISDPWLRGLALSTQSDERGNLEGAAVFAVLAPPARRTTVITAAVAFQALYDYVDTLAEQPVADPKANGRTLHLALLSALEPRQAPTDHYRHGGGAEDGGYLLAMIDTCRAALAALPCYEVVRSATVRAAHRMVAYQSLIHAGDRNADSELARWAHSLRPPSCELSWWETAAGAASSLGVFALFAAAAQPSLTATEAEDLEDAYFPWIGALHVLLDSLVDEAADARSGHHSLVSHYGGSEQAAARLAVIAGHARRCAEEIPQGPRHALILAAMTSFYVAGPGACSPTARPAADRVLSVIGGLSRPTLVAHRLRLGAKRLGQEEGTMRIEARRHTKEAPHPVT